MPLLHRLLATLDSAPASPAASQPAS